jgi:acyl carrier protein
VNIDSNTAANSKNAACFRRNGTMDIAEKVKEIISQQLDVDLAEVKEAASFIDDLGADSLAIVELVLAFEEQFEIDIPDEDTEKIRTVGDAISYIQEHKGK